MAGLRPRPSPVRRGTALQVRHRHPARGASHLALVEARPHLQGRRAHHGAVLLRRPGDHPRRHGVLPLARGPLAGLFAGRTRPDRCQSGVVLRRQVDLADRSGGDLPTLGDPDRRPPGLDLRDCLGRAAGRALARPSSHRPWTAHGARLLRGDPVAGTGIRGLRVHAVLVRRRPLPVPGRRRRDRGRRRRGGPRRGRTFRFLRDRRQGPACGRARDPRNVDVAAGKHLPQQHRLLQPHRRPQPGGAQRPPEPRPGAGRSRPLRGEPGSKPDRGRPAAGLPRYAFQPGPRAPEPEPLRRGGGRLRPRSGAESPLPQRASEPGRGDDKAGPLPGSRGAVPHRSGARRQLLPRLGRPRRGALPSQAVRRSGQGGTPGPCRRSRWAERRRGPLPPGANATRTGASRGSGAEPAAGGGTRTR